MYYIHTSYKYNYYICGNPKKMQPPLNRHCFVAHTEVYSVKKNAYTRLSLSLSLSLSPLEKRARGEVGGSWPWLGPTTPAVISNHPGYHMGTHRTDCVGPRHPLIIARAVLQGTNIYFYFSGPYW